MVRVLFTRAQHDLASHYLASYMKLLVDFAGAPAQGHQVMDLFADEATTLNFEDAMATFNPEVAILGGHGNCYSADTEILTENGWKFFTDLAKHEKVATLDKTGELQYQLPTAYHSFKYRGKMFYINGQRINLLVTPNHKLYVSWLGHEKGKMTYLPFRLVDAQDIGRKGVVNQLVRNEKVKKRIRLWNEVQELRKEKKWSIKRIAKILGIPKSTVHAWLSYGQDPKRTKLFKSTGTTTGHQLKFKRAAKWNCKAIKYFTLPAVPILNNQGRQSSLVNYKNAFRLKKLGYSLRKIAKTLNVPLGTINSWFYQGRKPRVRSDIQISIDDWVRFFGIYLAEGSASLGKSGKGRKKDSYIISITQNNNTKRRIIKRWVEAIANQVGFSAWEEHSNEHSKAIKFKNKQMYAYLKQFGHAKDKYIPKWVKMLPPPLLRILLNAMMYGDGTNKNQGYSTASKQLADDVQEIAMKIGKGAIIGQNKRTGVYYINITDDVVCVSKRTQKWINYDGIVYCVTVPNHLIYVRHNGKACWCGNSTTITGQDLQPLLQVGVNDDLMSGKISAIYGCSSGAKLGPIMVEKTAKEFYGWVVDFTFLYNPNYYPNRILEDPWAQPFFDSALACGYAILLGKPPAEVYELTIERYKFWWDHWIRQNDPMADDILTWLNWDMRGFIAITPDGIYAKKLAVELPKIILPVAAVTLLFLLSR